jgi:hypothetical protein
MRRRLDLSVSRRALLIGGAAMALPMAARAAAMAGVPASGALSFRAFRNGGAFGTHTVRFAASGAGMTVTIAVDYVVKFGPIAVFRYSLRGTETWQGGVLQGFRSEVDDDGSRHVTSGMRDGDALLVDGSKTGKYRAPPGALPSSHWNRHEMDKPMINSDTGELMRFSVAPRGQDMVTPATGPAFPAQHFALTGPAVLDLWYDASDVWASLRAVAKDGSIITYQRQ